MARENLYILIYSQQQIPIKMALHSYNFKGGLV